MKNRIIITAVFASILAMSALFASTEAEARCCWRGGYWVAPALIGGVIGYELAQPRPYYYPPAPVVVQTPPSVVYVQPPATTQAPPPGYHWQQIQDPQTGQTKMALIPN